MSLQNKTFWKGLYTHTHDPLNLPTPSKALCIRNNREHQTKSSAQQPDRRPAKQVNKALGPRATQVLSAEGATFLGVNGGTPSWPRARMTSPPFAPHPFGDHSHFSPCAGATGKPVLTARVLEAGGQGQLVQDQLQVPGLVSTVLAGTPRPGPLLPLPVSVYGTSPLSWDPGPLPKGTGSQFPAALLWAQAPGCFLRRAASLSDQVQDASGNRKSMRPQPSKLVLGCPGTPCTQGWGRCNELGRAVSAPSRGGLRAATALADARPHALCTDKAPAPRPGHP